MKKYKIYNSRYQLSKKLGGAEVPSKPNVFHADIFDNRSGIWKRCAFLTRNTYDECQRDADKYIKTGYEPGFTFVVTK